MDYTKGTYTIDIYYLVYRDWYIDRDVAQLSVGRLPTSSSSGVVAMTSWMGPRVDRKINSIL